MYSLKNILDKTPIQLSGAIVGILNLGVLLDVVDLTADQVSGVNVGAVLLLGLFVSQKTANKAVLAEIQADSNNPPPLH